MAPALLPFESMDMLHLTPITNLPAIVGCTWKQLGLLVAFGAAIGLVLALTVSLPVS